MVSEQTKCPVLCLDFCCSPFQIADAAKSSSEVDDLFIDDTGSGGYYPEDDDDFTSGSGSGKSLVTVAFDWVDTYRQAGWHARTHKKVISVYCVFSKD